MFPSIGHEVVYGHVIHTRRSTIGLDPFPSLTQIRPGKNPFQQVFIGIGYADNAPTNCSPGRVHRTGRACRAFSLLWVRPFVRGGRTTMTSADSCPVLRYVTTHDAFQRELDRRPGRSPRIRT